MGLFCTIVKKQNITKTSFENSDEGSDEAIVCCHQISSMNKKIKHQLIESQQTLQRMEIASLKRYAFVRFA